MRWWKLRNDKGEAGVGVTFLAVALVICLLVAALWIYRGGGIFGGGASDTRDEPHSDARVDDSTGGRTGGDRGRRVTGVVPGPVDRSSGDGGIAPPEVDADEEWQFRNVRIAEADMAFLLEAVDTFRSIKGREPTILEELAGPLTGHMDGLLGPHGVPTDPWGRDYVFGQGSRAAPLVWTLGSDGKEGGEGHAADVVGER